MWKQVEDDSRLSDLEHCVGGKGYDDSKQTKNHGKRIFLGRTDSGPVVFECKLGRSWWFLFNIVRYEVQVRSQ